MLGVRIPPGLSALTYFVSGCERKPDAERKRDSAQPKEKGAANQFK
jgi:hypothetical protein